MKRISLIIAAALTLSMLTACGQDNSSESQRSESSVSDSSTADSSSQSESSSDETTTTTTSVTSAQDSSSESETETTTTTATEETTGESTTASETATGSQPTTTSASTAATTVSSAKQTTAKPVTTQKPIVTTKATTKTTAKQTTKATTKATTKSNGDEKLIASLNPLEKALYNLMMGDNSSKNIEFIRQEFIKYGKSLRPNYVLDKNLYLWVDKNGKPTNNAYEANGFTDYACSYGSRGLNAMSIGTTEENIQAVKDTIKIMKMSIEDHLLSIKTDDDSKVHWYIQITRAHPTYVQNGYNCFVIFRWV